MQDKEESLYPMDWIEKAEKDFNRVIPRLEEGDIEDATVHLQQALEKYLKGYLLFKGWALSRTHNLRFLLDEAIKFNSSFTKFQQLCEEVTPYYFEDRYPFFGGVPSSEEVEGNLSLAKELIQIIKEEMGMY